MTLRPHDIHNPESLRIADKDACPACGGGALAPVIALDEVPANSCLMLDSAAEARAFPRGRIALTFCGGCGFIYNRAFDPLLTEYSERYEPTQAYSPTFQKFHKDLAARLVEGMDLHGKTLVEVGCGQGEFLHLLCKLGGNKGVGFDPCLDARRADVVGERATDVRLIGDFFSETSMLGVQADALLSKMTLEHIPAVGNFAALVAQLAKQSPKGLMIFIQIPESERILTDRAFWDVYYEHCNYFTEASLTNLFAAHGFKVDGITREYEGQYLAIVARYVGGRVPGVPQEEIARLTRLVETFRRAFADEIAKWRDVVATRVRAGKTVAIWGSGSKGVSFLTALGDDARGVDHVVDINPHRQGKFMVGSGHPIVGPDDHKRLKPDTVIVMNPVYRDEIAGMLAARGLSPELLTL